jgi:hypothetical protein
MKAPIDPAHVGHLFSYSPASGYLFWAKPGPGRARTRPAGCIDHYTGYRRVTHTGYTYQCNALVWAYHYGTWPRNPLDHVNGDRDDTHIENLVESTPGDILNHLKQLKRNRHIGVTPKNGKWQAQVGIDGTTVYIGLYDTEEAAFLAYTARRREFDNFKGDTE